MNERMNERMNEVTPLLLLAIGFVVINRAEYFSYGMHPHLLQKPCTFSRFYRSALKAHIVRAAHNNLYVNI